MKRARLEGAYQSHYRDIKILCGRKHRRRQGIPLLDRTHNAVRLRTAE